jgi:AcrR family transcriptional regulator
MPATDRKTDRKTQLMEAAIQVFYEKGFQKTRVSDIVSEAKVAQGTFYLYFKSKDDIFLQICSRFKALFAALFEGTDNLFSGTSHEEIQQRLLAFIRDMIHLYTDNEKLAKILFYETGNFDCPFKEVWKGIYADFIDMLRRFLERSRSDNTIRFEDAETEAAFLVGLFSRSLFYFIELKQHVDVEDLSRRMTSFILGGLTKQGVAVTSYPLRYGEPVRPELPAESHSDACHAFPGTQER